MTDNIQTEIFRTSITNNSKIDNDVVDKNFLLKKKTRPVEELIKMQVRESQTTNIGHSDNIKQKLFLYYCSLCGANVIDCDTKLESMPHRKTDDSIIAYISKIFFNNYMKRDKLMVIKRDINKYEKQYRYVCQECGVFIAYQSADFEEQDASNELKRRSNKIFSQNKKKLLYILEDAVVADKKQSSILIELDKIKEIQSKKLKSKN